MDMKKTVSESEARDSYWADIVARSTPSEIATLMLTDAQRLDDSYAASPLAMHLPDPATPLAMEIASHLTPIDDLEPELQRFLYDKMRSRLREANGGGDGFKEPPLSADGYLLASDMNPELQDLSKVRRNDRYVPPEELEGNERLKDIGLAVTGVPTAADVGNALKVLDYLASTVALPHESAVQLQEARAIITEHFVLKDTPATSDDQELETQLTRGELTTLSESWNDHVGKYHILRPPRRQQSCYICRFLLKDPHPVYKSMCRPCGAFNYAGLSISLPTSMKLPGKIALVTGARVNLGYWTALRLLRCGAKVIATTRYPNDAAVRYSQEPDFEGWQDRLKIIGADFRTARDAFGLVKAAQSALADWGADRLHILINNAAQTLTDSVKKEERAIAKETQQRQEASSTNLVQQTHYQPRVRGGIPPLALYGGDENQAQKPVPLLKDSGSSSEPPEISLPQNVKDDGRTELAEPYFKSSWVQDLNEIPYEDIISAHAVNAFVPLILCRELLPLMGELKQNRPSPSSSTSPEPTEQDLKGHKKTAFRKAQNRPNHLPQNPLAYILNVSSREGLFESNLKHSHKKGHHVHTNMTKAAINMIVQTEAASAWEARRVAMNTVDPGYMSSAPEMDSAFDGVRPLDWEDGVARVLWPVAIGEVEGRAVWGRFLKHFGVGDVRDAVER